MPCLNSSVKQVLRIRITLYFKFRRFQSRFKRGEGTALIVTFKSLGVITNCFHVNSYGLLAARSNSPHISSLMPCRPSDTTLHINGGAKAVNTVVVPKMCQ